MNFTKVPGLFLVPHFFTSKVCSYSTVHELYEQLNGAKRQIACTELNATLVFAFQCNYCQKVKVHFIFKSSRITIGATTLETALRFIVSKKLYGYKECWWSSLDHTWSIEIPVNGIWKIIANIIFDANFLWLSNLKCII